jgi:type II restriction enzyme
MNLQCNAELGRAYTSSSQIARVLSEEWCGRELYCAACPSDHLSSLKANFPAADFICPSCDQPFQLKCSRTWNQAKIVDAGYDSMLRAISSGRVPNLLVMQCTSDWFVRNLSLIPSVFIVETVIERRLPLSDKARRAGWVGCNILLGRIPDDGKIAVVANGSAVGESQVRQEFSRVRRLVEVPPSVRGWALDVLSAIRALGKKDFSLGEVYRFQPYLERIHPRNRNVRAKIRQQLQVLRDLGLIAFVGAGKYVVTG